MKYLVHMDTNDEIREFDNVGDAVDFAEMEMFGDEAEDLMYVDEDTYRAVISEYPQVVAVYEVEDEFDLDAECARNNADMASVLLNSYTNVPFDCGIYRWPLGSIDAQMCVPTSAKMRYEFEGLCWEDIDEDEQAELLDGAELATIWDFPFAVAPVTINLQYGLSVRGEVHVANDEVVGFAPYDDSIIYRTEDGKQVIRLNIHEI